MLQLKKIEQDVQYVITRTDGKSFCLTRLELQQLVEQYNGSEVEVARGDETGTPHAWMISALAGQKINAIKILRDRRFFINLKEAKDLVEKFLNDLPDIEMRLFREYDERPG